MRFSIDVGSELELKLYQAVLLYGTTTETATWRPSMAWCSKRRWKSRPWRRTTAQYSQLAGAGPAAGDWLPGGVLARPGHRANSRFAGMVDAGGGTANVLPRRIGT